MSFELLDALLVESGESPTGLGTSSSFTKSTSSDSEIFSGLNDLVEAAMRSEVRSTILESSLPDDVKLNHIGIVEDAEFSSDQILSFMQENIYPVMEMTGFKYGTLERDMIGLSLPVYETASILHFAKNGQLTSEGYAAVSKSDSSLYNSLVNESSDSSPTQKEIVRECFRDIIETYGIESEDEFNEVLKEAKDALGSFGADKIYPSIQETAELVSSYNVLAESYQLPSIVELCEADMGLKDLYKRSEDAKKAKQAARDAVKRKNKGPKAYRHAKVQFNNFKKTVRNMKNSAGEKLKPATDYINKKTEGARKFAGTKTGKIVGGVLGAAAIAAIAATAYKAYKNRQCGGLEGDALSKCRKAAAMKGLQAAQSAMSSCNKAKNPEKCKKSAMKEVEKWKARVAKA